MPFPFVKFAIPPLLAAALVLGAAALPSRAFADAVEDFGEGGRFSGLLSGEYFAPLDVNAPGLASWNSGSAAYSLHADVDGLDGLSLALWCPEGTSFVRLYVLDGSEVSSEIELTRYKVFADDDGDLYTVGNGTALSNPYVTASLDGFAAADGLDVLVCTADDFSVDACQYRVSGGVVSNSVGEVVYPVEVEPEPVPEPDPVPVTVDMGATNDAIAQYRDVANYQVVSDFFFVECASLVLLALNLGALGWLCFRAR